MTDTITMLREIPDLAVEVEATITGADERGGE